MGRNCQKPDLSIAKTGRSATPVRPIKRSGDWVLGVFQRRLASAAHELVSGGNHAASVRGLAELSLPRRIQRSGPVMSDWPVFLVLLFLY
ncbi:hypothetical protein VB152_01545 [Xanthomonas fragariae]|nr:hypothetical protein [Xanthomonas fragariae]